MKFLADKHHVLGIDHLLNNNRAALFMGMGLGKTSTSLTALDTLLTLGEARAALVVAPMRVANLTWPNEVAKWDHTRSMRVSNLRHEQGYHDLRNKRSQIYTINYEQLPNLVEKYLKKPGAYGFDTIIFDELTNFKNPKSKRAKAIAPFLYKLQRRWGLTGTPTPNHLTELFAQIRILDDGQRLGKSFDAFQRAYFYPTDYMEYNWEPFDGAEEKIYGKIADIALTLRSEDYLDVPQPLLLDEELTLPVSARARYKEMEKELILTMGDGEVPVVAPNAAALTNKLLQITGGFVYDEEGGTVFIHDAKIQALQRLMAHYKKLKEPVLVGCNYIHEQKAILKACPELRLFREEDLDDWNRRKIPGWVAHPKSIGHGLNLQEGCNVVIWYSLPWGELYNQFNSRLVRRGQGNVTRIHRLLCANTMDDVVAETLRDKDAGQTTLLKALTTYRLMLDNA